MKISKYEKKMSLEYLKKASSSLSFVLYHQDFLNSKEAVGWMKCAATASLCALEEAIKTMDVTEDEE